MIDDLKQRKSRRRHSGEGDSLLDDRDIEWSQAPAPKGKKFTVWLDRRNAINPFCEKVCASTSAIHFPNLSTRKVKASSTIICFIAALLLCLVMFGIRHTMPTFNVTPRISFPVTPPELNRNFAVVFPLHKRHADEDLGPLTILPKNSTIETNLNITSLAAQHFQREIRPQYEDLENHFIGENLNNMDETRVSYMYWHDEELESLHFDCRRPAWNRLHFPNCNEIHAIALTRDYDEVMATHAGYEQDYDSYLVGRGFYRDAWVYFRPAEEQKTILKTTRFSIDFDHRTLYMVHKDALIMERFSGDDRIISPYGHCAGTVLVEAVPFEVERYVVPGSGYMKKGQLQDALDVSPQNKFTAHEKLTMALEMAESLAILHGYESGVIVHGDVQLQQWLRSGNNTLKLGDFNRARIMEWSEKEKRYCKFSTGSAFGNYRSPEEFSAKELDETSDVYSFGNNIYGLLTGLWVFYENEDDLIVQGKVMSGKKPYVDPRYRQRSFEERLLVDVMEKCWETDPEKRIDIFDAVKMLRDATHTRQP